MQISSVNPAFGRSSASTLDRRTAGDMLLQMNDGDIRQLALLQTVENVDRKKNNKITNALFYNAPLAAGIATAVLTKGGKTKIFSTQLTGVAGRMAKGLKVAGVWTAALAAVDLLGFAKNKLAQKSESVRKFDKEHPILSMGAMLAAGIGAISLVYKGAGKLGTINAPKFMKNATKTAGEFLNKNKKMVAVKNGYVNLVKKTPAAIKNIAATMLDWAPTALLFGGLLNSIAGTAAENREFNKNYNNLKDAQIAAARERVDDMESFIECI